MYVYLVFIFRRTGQGSILNLYSVYLVLIFRRTGQGSILKDEEYYKTANSTFKPKALRNPNTYKNLQKNLPKEGSKKDKDSSFTLKLKPALLNDKYQEAMSKEFKEMSAKESSRLPSVTLKPVKK